MGPSEQTGEFSSLDSLRTVEFRQTLRGYHIDDVDDYLERVAVEVDALRDQLRTTQERLRQASERIAALEAQRGERPAPVEVPVPAPAPADADEALRRTLEMAQRFVDQAQREARAEAEAMLSEAKERAAAIVGSAETEARQAKEASERALRDEVGRLQHSRERLATELERLGRQVEDERSKLRSVANDLLAIAEGKLAPNRPAALGPAGAGRTAESAAEGGSAPTTRLGPSPAPSVLPGGR